MPFDPPAPSPDPPTSRLYVARTTLAAIAALFAARLTGMPEPYWAAITTLVVMQSSLVASWSVSWRRLLGTVIGATVGGVLATFLAPSAWLFGAAVFGTGMLCAAVRLDRVAYRFAGVTLAIVMLVARSRPAWIIALHRFTEVSIGIAVALLVTAAWPEKTATSPGRA